MKLSPLQVLSTEEIAEIHEATLDILATCGVKILNAKMLDILAEHGLEVDTNAGVARFSRACIEDALSHVPAQFEMFDREGRFAFVLGDGVPKIAAGHNAVFWVDSDSGERRNSTVADLEQFARICERLPHIDMIGIPAMPQDVPDARASLLYGVKACVENSVKPIFFSTDNAPVNRAVIDMLEAVFPGRFASQAYGISQLSPTSPLFWEAGVLDAVMDTVARDVPLAILPEPNAGVSAPYTLAGLLAMNNAECLSGLAMAQLLKPGARVMYANSWTTTDMRQGYALVGSVETTLCEIAGAQLARFYRVPSHTTAPNSDNHAHDEQNAWEKTLGTFCAVAAGNDLLVNCGMFATGMTCSHEQLVMDEEISAMSRRLAAGIEVNEATIAKDLIAEIGPQGTGYLTALHTLERLRSDEYFVPRLAVRGPYSLWQAQGGKDTYQVARDAVRELGAEPGAPLDDAQRERLEEILSAFRAA
ncbi:MAG TPA: trimethylamine methyltransferase family protein [Candidatus Hydrogenedentes bacterium]|nr:trimethylamine methyltransferase family protein [Candidatus Hydrogenedentota bacterium]HPG67705.1 trimethylamine methyltransferase family protein [Candidatus Hydrogenedentota bacterium]